MAANSLNNRRDDSFNTSISVLHRLAPFNPVVLASFPGSPLSGWYAARNHSLLDNADMATWPDASGFGTGRLFSWGGSGIPKYNTGFSGGRPSIQLDGTGGFSTGEGCIGTALPESFLVTGDYSVYIVASCLVITNDIGGANADIHLAFGTSGIVSVFKVGWFLQAAVNKVGVRQKKVDGTFVIAATPYTLGSVVLIEVIHRAGNIILNVNGVEVIVACDTSPTQDTSTQISHGSLHFYNGHIAEIITYRGALEDAERTIVKDAIKREYAL